MKQMKEERSVCFQIEKKLLKIREHVYYIWYQVMVIKSVNQSFDKTKTHVKDFWDVSIRGLHVGPGELGPEGFYLQKNIVV